MEWVDVVGGFCYEVLEGVGTDSIDASEGTLVKTKKAFWFLDTFIHLIVKFAT